MDLGINGYFHFFDDLSEFLKVEESLVFYNIAIGKYIILHDQISTKDGRVFGKKDENIYAFTTVYSEQSTFDKVLEDGIIAKENCINSLDIDREEFDKFNNLKKATTLNDYDELLEYIEKNKLK